MENIKGRREQALKGENFVLPRNMRNLKYVSVCVILFGSLNMISYRWTEEKYPESIRALYMSLLLFLLLSGLVSLGLSGRARRSRRYIKKHSSFLKTYIDTFMVLIMTAGGALALLDQMVCGQMSAFVILYVLCAVLLLTEPGKFWRLQAVPLLLVAVCLPIVQDKVELVITDYVDLIILVLCMSFQNRYSYFSFCRNGASHLEISRLADKDELTGLNNRRKLRIFMEDTVKRRAAFSSIGIIMFDIDYFKKFNDYYGHAMGDYVLKSIGAVLNELSGQYEAFAARYGGEEFIVILRSRMLAEVSDMALDIKNAIADLQIENNSLGYSGVVSVSIGQYWTRRLPADIEFQELIKKADAALYKAKRSGRDRICKHSA